jgi:hypothetical protein
MFADDGKEGKLEECQNSYRNHQRQRFLYFSALFIVVVDIILIVKNGN